MWSPLWISWAASSSNPFSAGAVRIISSGSPGVVSILAGAASSAAVVGGMSSIIASVFSSGSTATGIVVSVAVGWLSKGSDGSSMLNPSSCPSWSMSACGASIAGSMAGAFSGSLSL